MVWEELHPGLCRHWVCKTLPGYQVGLGQEASQNSRRAGPSLALCPQASTLCSGLSNSDVALSGSSMWEVKKVSLRDKKLPSCSDLVKVLRPELLQWASASWNIIYPAPGPHAQGQPLFACPVRTTLGLHPKTLKELGRGHRSLY